MADSITHRDLYRLLGLELPWSADQLREMLANNPDNVGRIADEIERSGLADLELVLAEPLVNSGDSAPLVAGNVQLTPRKIRALLTRQVQDLGRAIGPFVLQLSATMLEHYQQMIAGRLETVVEQLRSGKEGNTKAIHDLIRRNKEMTCIEEYFGEIADRAFTAPAAIPRMLPVLTDSQNDSCLANSINAAFIAMSVMLYYQQYPTAQAQKAALRRVGVAALLQDVGLMLDPHMADDCHPRESARLAVEMGLSEDVGQLIALHHSLVDEEGTPLLRKPEGIPVAARVLIATNVFLSEVRNAHAGQNFECMKNLSYLGEMDMVDKRAVKILSRMYLPKLKSFVLERATELASQCVIEGNQPILWPISGDKIPSIFLCQNQDCEHRTAQVSQLATDIPFIVDGQVLSTIGRGEYFTCPYLTGRLRALYAAVKNQIKR